ncbi:glycosyltransferase [Acetobacter lambici]|uniref:Glycosyltransferase n=1 Tax=Acetobacter lambici TaxID=1332824 RepID=A0ABT1F0H9_9PROT|nr:glycosyltransferase [Acetobacter lambici]MCP1242430.1 glycosyltransferase [Acetobacter lambici]MCP1258705.1 glycosyltransferase [Acetobacter lambici]NHO56910.1 glycosyltransferase [Acetobacter lambici]
MKIAYIINSVESGGAALPVPAITKVMRDAGHHVEVFALTRRNGLAIEPLQDAGLTLHIRPGTRKDHLAALRWLNRQMRSYKPDVLWTSLSRATLLGQMVGKWQHIPVVSWQHSARLKPFNAALLRHFKNRSALWVADSSCVAEQTRLTLGVTPDHLVEWPIFRADPHMPTAAPWQPGTPVRIGTLGRLHPVKGYDTLCAAIALLQTRPGLPPFEVLIGGEGEERPHLEDLIARDGLPIQILGHIKDPSIFLTQLHLYTQPSLWEGFCLAAHEAMLAALPVVASDAGEIPSSITPQTGRIVPPQNITALADALEDLLKQPEHLAAMGQRARASVLARFGAQQFDQIGQNILARVEQIVAKNH